VAHRLIGAQNAQIGTALVLIGLELKPAQIGGSARVIPDRRGHLQ